jgi:AcrR family transcriptional regulator
MPKKVDRAARREEILAAAVKVFARKGFAASRIEDVAAEAGIGKGVVYLYFDSRDELLLSVLRAYAAQTKTMLASLGSGSPLERLERLVHLVINSAAAQPDHARVLLDLWAMTPSIDDWADGPMRDMTSVYREYRGAVVDLLREASESGETRPGIGEHHATVIVGAIEGCLLQWLLDPNIALTELAAPIVSVCMDGMRA